MQLSKKSLKRMRADLLEITPEITSILDDFTAVSKMRIVKKAGEAIDEAAATETGITIFKEYIDMLLTRQYDRIVKILAVIYEIEPAALEDKTMEEIVDMIVETLSDKVLIRFFPQLAQWARKMQSDT